MFSSVLYLLYKITLYRRNGSRIMPNPATDLSISAGSAHSQTPIPSTDIFCIAKSLESWQNSYGLTMLATVTVSFPRGPISQLLSIKLIELSLCSSCLTHHSMTKNIQEFQLPTEGGRRNKYSSSFSILFPSQPLL